MILGTPRTTSVFFLLFLPRKWNSCTWMVNKMGPRLRELSPAQDAESHNLGPEYLCMLNYPPRPPPLIKWGNTEMELFLTCRTCRISPNDISGRTFRHPRKHRQSRNEDWIAFWNKSVSSYVTISHILLHTSLKTQDEYRRSNQYWWTNWSLRNYRVTRQVDY